MPAKAYTRKPQPVHAMQLLIFSDPDGDTAHEMVDWCKGVAQWSHDGRTGTRDVRVDIDKLDNKGVSTTVRTGEWLILDVERRFFFTMSNEDFHRSFNTEQFDGPPTCRYCLSDPRYTPMADPGTKQCPQCGVAYSGPPRKKEYNMLAQAGLVSKESG